MADKKQFGIPATCGIGTNLYLAKIALDITAKHAEDCIGYLDEERYTENQPGPWPDGFLENREGHCG